MTKKDFRLIATVLLYARPDAPPPFPEPDYTAFDAAKDTWDKVVGEFCRVLKGDNPRFDEERFKAACGA